MREGLVTVVVPVYNVEKYLNRCIESIVNQTYTDLEIILVDDGSPDRCPQMCDEWAERDARIKVIHKANAGAGMARNTGMEHASGEFICFFDSDDYVDKTTVEKARKKALEEDAEIVLFGMSNVDKHGNIVNSRSPETKIVSFRGADVKEILLPDLIESGHKDMTVKNLFLSLWSCLFSMKLVARANWRFMSERLYFSEDSFALIELYQYVNCVAILKEPLYFYCENESSLSHSTNRYDYVQILRFYTSAMRLAEEVGYGDNVKKRIAGLFFTFVVVMMKCIATMKIKVCEKRRKIVGVVQDRILQEALKTAEGQYESRAKNIFYGAMKRQKYGIVLFLIYLQTAKERIKESR